MNLQIRGALDVFYTGDEKCLPGGPHFDRAFYLAWTAIIGSLFGMLGVSLFQMILSKRTYRLAFWSTTVLQVAAAIIDIAIVMRWNLRIGISDKLFYVLGDSMLQEVVRLALRRWCEGLWGGKRELVGYPVRWRARAFVVGFYGVQQCDGCLVARTPAAEHSPQSQYLTDAPVFTSVFVDIRSSHPLTGLVPRLLLRGRRLI